MDSLMAALVAALLIRATDPSADFAAIALIVTQAVAAAGGWLVASHLNVHAQRLLFAFSLLLAGGGAIWPRKPAVPGGGGHRFVAVTSKLIASGSGDRTMCATFAVAAGGVPVLAGVGGLIGGLVMLTAAAIAGEALWRGRLARAIVLTIGGRLLAAGAWLAVSALRLI